MNNDERNDNRTTDLAMPFYTAPVASDGSTTDINYNAPVVEVPPVEKVILPDEPVKEELHAVEQSTNGYVQTQINSSQGFTSGIVPNSVEKKLMEDSDQDRLLKAYIGKNYDKFLTNSFNWAFFFFGISYLLYRKMYMKAILLTVIPMVIGFVIQLLIPGLPGVIGVPYPFIFFVYTFKVNSDYYCFATAKVRKIEYSNPTLTPDQLEKLCASKGGGSILNWLLGTLIHSFVVSIVVGILIMIAAIVFVAQGQNYNGALSVEKDFDLNNYSYVLPNSYEETPGESNLGHFYEYKDNNLPVCNFEIIKTKGYKKASQLAEEYMNFQNDMMREKPNLYPDRLKVLDPFDGQETEWIVLGLGHDKKYYFGSIGGDVFFIALTANTNDYSVSSKCFSDAEEFIRSFKAS